MSLDLSNIGPTLRFIQEAKQVTQLELQNCLSTPCNISKVERNLVTVSFLLFMEIITLLDVSIAEFFYLHDREHNFDLEQIKKYIGFYYQRIPADKVTEYRKKLVAFGRTSFNDLKTRNEKFLFHKISCFYYLNFESNYEKGRKHAYQLLDYYKNVIHSPLLSEFEMFPVVIPYVSLLEGARLLSDLQHYAQKHQTGFKFIEDLYIRSHLNFAKRALAERDALRFSEALDQLSFLLYESPSQAFHCEYLILRGIFFYQYERQLEAGAELITEGLAIAKQKQYTNIYTNWLKYWQDFLDYDDTMLVE